MIKAKQLASCFIVWALGFNMAFGEAKPKDPKYPQLIEWKGDVWITDAHGKRGLLKKKQILKLKGQIETAVDGQVKVLLDEHRSFVLKGGSQISFPSISWGEGQVPLINFHKGEMHWRQNLESEGSYKVAVTSDLFEFILPVGIYTLSVNPDRALASIKVFQGRFEFSPLNGEESVSLQAGQQASFQGIIENGEIAYDVLLKGKKIPRGQLSAVTALSKDEIKNVEKEEQILKKSAELHRKAEQEAVKKAQQTGLICRDPSARFNECAWICLNNPKGEKKICNIKAGASCVRRRCNANGDWADEIILNAEKSTNFCKAQAFAALCDY